MINTTEKGQYKSCVILATELKVNLKNAFKTLRNQHPIFKEIESSISKCIGKENKELADFVKCFNDISWPSFTATRDANITAPDYIDKNLEQIDFNKILVKSLDQTDACFIEKDPDFNKLKELIKNAVEQGFVEKLGNDLKDLKHDHIVIEGDFKSMLNAWFAQSVKFPPYNSYLAKLKASLDIKLTTEIINNGTQILSKKIADILENHTYDLDHLTIDFWNILGKEKALEFEPKDFGDFTDLYFPNYPDLTRIFDVATLGFSKQDVLNSLNVWKNSAAIFMGNAVQAIYRYNFGGTKFKLASFLDYLKEKAFSKDFRASHISEGILTKLKEGDGEIDPKDKITTEPLASLWNNAIQSIDEQAFFDMLLAKFKKDGDINIFVELQTMPNFVLPNQQDIEFALLDALMKSPSRKSSGNSKQAWLAVETYKNHRESSRNWLDRTKFAIDEFYQKVHEVRLEYKLAKERFEGVLSSCKQTIVEDNKLRKDFAELMFGSVINLATSALNINSAITKSKIGGLITEGKNQLTAKLADVAIKWSNGKDEKYKGDAEFIFDSTQIGFDDLTTAIENIKVTILNYIDLNSGQIHNTLEVEMKPESGLKNTKSDLATDKANYTIFNQALQSSVDKLIVETANISIDGLSEKFEKLMFAHWLKNDAVLRAKGSSSWYGGWDFTIARTLTLRKKLQSLGVFKSSKSDPFPSMTTGGSIWSHIGMFTDAVCADFGFGMENVEQWGKSMQEIQDWAKTNATLQSPLFK
ncbi:MAG: hypothetical protein GY810_09940 [Aureispira sp.]|nr:hypothetical protein [Aureispira sp.]